MLLEHQGERPNVHESCYVAPTAVICGDVSIGPDSQILFGAVIVAERGAVTIGSQCIINHVLVGPHAYLTGCAIADDVFIAYRRKRFQ